MLTATLNPNCATDTASNPPTTEGDQPNMKPTLSARIPVINMEIKHKTPIVVPLHAQIHMVSGTRFMCFPASIHSNKNVEPSNPNAVKTSPPARPIPARTSNIDM